MTSITTRVTMPILFVFLWSTGFIGARFGLPYAEPLTFLGTRMALVLVVLLPILLWKKTPWPSERNAITGQIITGLLIHGCYLGGVFLAIFKGMPAGVTAMVVSMHPVLTTLLARVWLDEKLSVRKTFGLLAGLAGVFLVLGKGLTGTSEFGFEAIIYALISLAGMSLGTIHQKKHSDSCDLLAASFIQYAAAAIVFFALAAALETMVIEWNLTFTLTMAWLVIALSVVAILLLLWLIREGEASHVASLFYLVPPLTVLEAWLLFDEPLTLTMISGLLLCTVAVWMIVGQKKLPEITPLS